jgi:tetratricopeptide (TPR) repeat protein
MNDIKTWTIAKILAVVLCVLIAAEAQWALAGQAQQADPLTAQFNAAKAEYFAGKYEDAKIILEKLIAELGRIDGYDTLKGSTYLLAGATYEKLKLKEPSVKYYCRAKEILGQDKTFEGLDLRTLKWYKEICPGAAGIIAPESAAPRPRRSGGGFIWTIIGLGVIAGLIWYLFFSKNAPFKKAEEEAVTTFSSTCYTTLWKFSISSEWSGSAGTVTLTPDVLAGNYPKPSQNNNWEDQVTYTLSATGGGTLISLNLKIDLELGGGDNARRQDVVTVDGSELLNVTNTFSESCSAPGKKLYENVYSRGSTGTFTLKHKVVLSKSGGIGAGAELIRK